MVRECVRACVRARRHEVMRSAGPTGFRPLGSTPAGPRPMGPKKASRESTGPLKPGPEAFEQNPWNPVGVSGGTVCATLGPTPEDGKESNDTNAQGWGSPYRPHRPEDAHTPRPPARY